MRGPDAVPAAPPAAPLLFDASTLDALIEALHVKGFRVIAPTRRDNALVYGEIESAADLPAGWTDIQEAGIYRLMPREDGALFGYAVGPHAWKRFLHEPVLRLVSARAGPSGMTLDEADGVAQPTAFLGVRACELAAIARQDQVFLDGPYVDHQYAIRRAAVLLIAVNCTAPSGTCFCASMGTGPRAGRGADLTLTELLGGGRHVFLAEPGTARGAALLDAVPHRDATPDEVADAGAALAAAEGRMGRTLRTAGLHDALLAQSESPRWDEVAARCLTCGNCTMACPTCFCATVDDTVSLRGDHAERWRKWDTCFSVDFSYLYGGSVRLSARSRYRQWLTHKLATWHDQFGVSGCVGCGRCITWCPVGIDMTVEAGAFLEASGARGSAPPAADGGSR